MALNFYKSGADDGSALESSIQPSLDGERGNALILNRPAQNLRNRSEVTRKSWDIKELLAASDRGFVIGGEPDTKIVFQTSGAGYSFRLNSTGSWNDHDRDLVLLPLNSSSTWSGSVPVMAKYVYDDMAGGSFSLYPLVGGVVRKVAAGAHQILFRTFKVSGQNLPSGPVVTIEGSSTPSTPDPTVGPVTIAVQIADNGSTTIQQLVDAVNAHIGAHSIVTAAVLGGGSHSLSTTIATPVRFYEGSSADCVGGVDDESFKITGLQLHNFFQTNVIPEGGFLVLDFYQAAQRLGFSLLEDASLVLSVIVPGDDPGDTRNIADSVGVIPICKVLGGKLYFANGRVFQASYPDGGIFDIFLDSLAENNRLRNDLLRTTGTPYGDYMLGAVAKSSTNLVLSTGTVASQLTKLADLGNNTSGKGSAMVGSAEITVSPFAPLSAGTLASQMTSVLNQLSNAVGTSHGVSTVGVEAYGSRLSRGYISDQLHTCWDNLVSHIQGNTDKHKFVAMERPFVFVSLTTNEGDYTDIPTAINALKSTGGTIYVKQGTYNTATSYQGAGSFDYPIDVIGLGEVYWSVSATGYHVRIDSGCQLRTRLSFENITFRRGGNGACFDITAGYNSSYPWGEILIENCRFSLAGTNNYRVGSFNSNHRFTVRNCSIKSDVNDFQNSAIYATQTATVQVIRNKFENCAVILEAYFNIGSGGGYADVRDNEFYQCGHDGDPLVKLYGAKIARVERNNYPAYTHGSTDFAGLCLTTYCDSVFIDGNYAYSLKSPIATVGANNSGDTGYYWVTRNTSLNVLATGYAIYVNGGAFALVSGNHVKSTSYSLALQATTTYLKSVVFHGNSVDGPLTMAIGSGAYGVVSQNQLVQPSIGMDLVTIGSSGLSRWLVTGNDFLGSASYPTAGLIYNAIVCGNLMTAVGAGLWTGPLSIISGNHIVTQPGASSVNGINLSSSLDSILSKNRIVLSPDQTTRYAILGWNTTPAYVIIRNNWVKDAGEAVRTGPWNNSIFDGNQFRNVVIGFRLTSCNWTILNRNRIDLVNDINTCGIRADANPGFQSMIVTKNSVNGPGSLSIGMYFVFPWISGTPAQFYVITDNVLSLTNNVLSGTDQGISVTVGMVTSPYGVIAGNIIYATVLSNLGSAISVSSSSETKQLVLWENVIRNAGDYFHDAISYNPANTKGVGLGKDNTTYNFSTYNLYEEV
jgi:hypothetical protein